MARMASGNIPMHPDGLDPDSFDRPVFRATIRPNQSLSPHGFRTVMIACGAVSLVTSVACIRAGFWPVAGFFGLDMAASSEATRRLLDWTPTGPTLIEDIDAGAYGSTR